MNNLSFRNATAEDALFIARGLVEGIENGKALNLDVTLAVDPINDRAKTLYRSLGFMPSGTLFIFGHDYEKMIINAKQ